MGGWRANSHHPSGHVSSWTEEIVLEVEVKYMVGEYADRPRLSHSRHVSHSRARLIVLRGQVNILSLVELNASSKQCLHDLITSFP